MNTQQDWTEWHGEGKPELNADNIEVKTRDGSTYMLHDGCVWHHTGWAGDIVAYRVVDMPEQQEESMIDRIVDALGLSSKHQKAKVVDVYSVIEAGGFK